MIALAGLQITQAIETGTGTPLQRPKGFAQAAHQTLGLQQIIHLRVIHQAPLTAVVLFLDLWPQPQRQVLADTRHHLLDGLTTMGTTDPAQLVAGLGFSVGERLQTLLAQGQFQGLQQFAQGTGQLRAHNAAQCLADDWGNRCWHDEGKPPARINVLRGL